ncbi:CCA tRNA nucleotidyltransferase [Lacrimispora saccharolytica]|uniref:CCA tRNA nucleotidyltransferase n=1 Tax=Lacrimispora saccharolytica TaxID=84030 RepID=UPI0005A2AA8C|nr:CCA tRNA nucleotidyltransferase [Lacrimispora saccharolytica]QRV22164.1 CCA tRNA nucleotidyltransferase [Lacrimispora saccharolytica]
MKIQVPDAAKRIIEQLNTNGFEAYVVGGCVRDSLLGRMPEDWDITTSAKPEQVKEIFKRTVDTGIQHGTVTVLIDHEGYEVTTYRIDGEYEDGRHPKSVEFTGSLLEDLKRRDFTINAMAYSDREGLVDAFGGEMDLERRTIRCVGNSLDRFTEDALRILRAIRFSAQLDFTLEEDTRAAISLMAPNMGKVSKERIQVELTKLLLSGHPERIKAVYDNGIAPYISPHFKEAGRRLKETEKIGNLPLKKHMRWSGFLRQEEPQDAVRILKELKLDNDTIHQTKTLVSFWKMEIPADKPAIRHVMSGLSQELFEDLLCFQKVFCPNPYQAQLTVVEQFSEEILRAGDCIRLKDMAVTGRELMDAGMKPGPEMGAVLNRLFQIVLNRPECNNREYLMKSAEHFLEEQA